MLSWGLLCICPTDCMSKIDKLDYRFPEVTLVNRTSNCEMSWPCAHLLMCCQLKGVKQRLKLLPTPLSCWQCPKSWLLVWCKARRSDLIRTVWLNPLYGVPQFFVLPVLHHPLRLTKMRWLLSPSDISNDENFLQMHKSKPTNSFALLQVGLLNFRSSTGAQ